MNLAALELDFIELRWATSLRGFNPAGLRAGTARWLLARADEAEAVHWGRAVGMGLFQGDAARVHAGLPATITAGAGTGLGRARSAA